MTGDRIKQARLIAGLTPEEVIAQLVPFGITLTKKEFLDFEENQAHPNAAVLRRLGKVLHVKAAYFVQEPDVKVTWVAFRKTPHLTSAQAERIQAFAKDRAEKQSWLQLELYPAGDVCFPHPRPVRTVQDAEQAADFLRQQWDLGTAPIESVAQAFEDHGGILLFWEEDQGRFDGLSGWADETIPIAVVNNGSSVDRRRFNLAHELGHMVMHCSDLSDEEQERLANRFAAAFLVPAKVAIRELGAKRRDIHLEELAILRGKYGLSMQAWIRRAYELGIIDDTAREKLFQEVNENGKSPQRCKELARDEEPKRLLQMVLHALSEFAISEEKALELCPGCIQIDNEPLPLPLGRKYSARDLMELPPEERDAYLAEILPNAIREYATNEDLIAIRAVCDGYKEYD